MGESQPRAKYGIAVLTFINFLNVTDRCVGLGVIPFVERDFGISHAQAGLLGTFYIAVHVVGLPLAGYLGDRTSRRAMISGSVLLLSAASLGSGVAPHFPALLFWRVVLGLGDSVLVSVAAPLIADLVPASRRNGALGLFSLAGLLGAAVGYALGAWMGQMYSWQSAFFVAAAPGLLTVVLTRGVPDPPRGATEAIRLPPIPWRQGVRELLVSPMLLVITAARTILFFATMGLAVWIPSFLQAERGFSPKGAGFWFGATTAVAGCVGILGGGKLSSLADRRGAGKGIQFAAAMVALAALLMASVAAVTVQWQVVLLILVAQIMLFVNTAPILTALCDSARPDFRAQALSLSALIKLMLGGVLAPPLTGYLGQRFSLEWAIQLQAIPTFLAGAALFIAGWLARKHPLQKLTSSAVI
jgi:predicted MFS family arabinose efflux permease